MFKRVEINDHVWAIYEEGHDYLEPQKAVTFAFDTETFAYLDGKILSQKRMLKKLKGVKMAEKRERLSSSVWCWQCYDEINGFFMTNDFLTWLVYQCRAGYKFGWCYNAKFDFSQIDYKILAEQQELWKPHDHDADEGKAYNKAQPFTYESIHNDQGARYAYKLWTPYKPSTKHGKDSHTYVHATEYRDFMNLFPGGLKKVLESLDVKDNDGNDVRKLEMDYQAVDIEHLTENEIQYCCNDVKGLYFAVKKFNVAIEEQSNGERHIFGKQTNIMTAGGFAKAELLRSLYPDVKPRYRLAEFQREHPLTVEQDKFIREHHLYRGGISYVNPYLKGKFLYSGKRKLLFENAMHMNETMKRYDVNSEYPFSMSIIQDLIGKPFKISFDEWLKMPKAKRAEYECIYILTSVFGSLKDGYLGMWYDPFKNDFVDEINETGMHLMFEREFEEMQNWYDIDFSCDTVLLIKRGKRAYKPFVDENYKLKSSYKAAGNIAASNASKLKLNSSYGKLAERVERQTGHYELNKETGAIHFVIDKVEIEEGGIMNVIIGSLITAVARVWILSHIRKICRGPEMKWRFVYIDTDSIHAFASFDECDPLKLGALKLEAECVAVKYIAPKTYIDIESISSAGYIQKYEVHTKGINIASVMQDFKSKKKHQHIKYVNDRFNYGQQFVCLVALNVRGGKVLVPTEKYLARLELAPDEHYTINYGYNGAYLSEI